MEYTKDMILHVNYGQEGRKQKENWNLFNKIGETITRHKIIATVISITVMLMILDFMLIASFVQVLGSL